jgi:site-specific DNA recombinase
MSNKPKAVFYARMSSEKQEDSAKSQIELDLPFFQSLYEIVEIYKDEGISASKDDALRLDYQRLLVDLTTGKFSKDKIVICCRDAARFSRQNVYDAGKDKSRLINAGKHLLHSRQEGVIDWSSMTGQIVDSVNQCMSNEHSLKTAKGSLNGRIRAMKQGKNTGSPVPFAYAKQITKPNGIEVIARGEKGRRLKEWNAKLILGDADEVSQAKEMFDLALTTDLSVREIARKMIDKYSNGWNRHRVLRMLRNPVYAGGNVIGRHSNGTHYRCNGTEAEAVGGTSVSKEAIVWDVNDALVSREQFDLLQRKHEKTTSVPRGKADYLFSGLVKCGVCGMAMSGAKRKDGKIFYQCTTSRSEGNKTCMSWLLYEDEVRDFITGRIAETVENKILESMEVITPKKHDGGLASMEKKLASMEDSIAKGIKKIMLIDDSLLADFQAGIVGLKKDRDTLANEIESLKASATDMAWKEEIAAFWAMTKTVFVDCYKGQHKQHWMNVDCVPWKAQIAIPTLRDLLKRLDTRLTVWFEKGEGKRRWRLSRGLITGQIHGCLPCVAFSAARTQHPRIQLQHVLRIDIHRQLDPRRRAHARQDGTQHLMQQRGTGAVHLEMKAKIALETKHRRLRRTE